jgi:hypothetical protein
MVVYLIIFILLMKSNNSSFSRINFNILSMFYAQYDNIGSMYKLAVKVIDEVNSACAGRRTNPSYEFLSNYIVKYR